MIDTTDHGWVYNPKSQPKGIVASGQEDTVDNARLTQIAGRYILGATDSLADDDPGMKSDRVDGYFLLDTQLGKRTTVQNREELQGAARALGIDLNLERIDRTYSRYRFTWFDKLADIVLIVPPIVLLALIALWIARVRKARDLSPPDTLMT